MFWDNFLPNFVANLLADGLIIGLALFLLERYFHKRDEAQKESKERRQRRENLKVSVNMLWSEIEHNRTQLKMLVENLSQRPKPNIIYPALETSAWEVVGRQQIMEGLQPKDFANLLKIYNRTYTVNKMYYQMLDKIEWILLGTDSTVRREYIEAIIGRSKELLTFIEEVFPKNLIDTLVKAKASTDSGISN